jgi:hypothetical protein
MSRARLLSGPEVPTGLQLAWPMACMWYRWRRLGDLRSRPVVLVYQMAKVGSTTVVRSLRRSHPQLQVFHVHTLTSDGIEALGQFYRSCRVPSLPWAAHLLTSGHLAEQLDRGVAPGCWRVVTLVRDPVARNVSLLFQIGARCIPGFRQLCDAKRLDVLALLHRFEDLYPRQFSCMSWFDDELRRVFDVDLFAVPFSRDKGWQIYAGPVADALLIRTDRLSETGDEALGQFLGLSTVAWRQSNIGARKANGRRYDDLLRRLVLPESYVDRIYASPGVQHFFTAAELARMKVRWCGARETDR